MMKVKKQQKQILQTSLIYKIPDASEFDDTELVSELKSLHKTNKIIFGINSVLKSSITNSIKCIIIPQNENFDNAIQAILSVAAKYSIPVLSVKISADELAKEFCLNKLSVLGITEEITDKFKSHSQTLKEYEGLPPTFVEVDTYVVKPKK